MADEHRLELVLQLQVETARQRAASIARRSSRMNALVRCFGVSPPWQPTTRSCTGVSTSPRGDSSAETSLSPRFPQSQKPSTRPPAPSVAEGASCGKIAGFAVNSRAMRMRISVSMLCISAFRRARWPSAAAAATPRTRRPRPPRRASAAATARASKQGDKAPSFAHRLDERRRQDDGRFGQGHDRRLLGDVVRALQEVLPEAPGALREVQGERPRDRRHLASTTRRTASPTSRRPTARSSPSAGTTARRSRRSGSPRTCRRRTSSARTAS